MQWVAANWDLVEKSECTDIGLQKVWSCITERVGLPKDEKRPFANHPIALNWTQYGQTNL